MRKELLITWEDEIRLMDQLVQKLLDLNISLIALVYKLINTYYKLLTLRTSLLLFAIK